MYVSIRSLCGGALLCSLAIAPLSGCGSEAAKSPPKAEQHFEGDGHDHKEGDGHDHKEGDHQ